MKLFKKQKNRGFTLTETVIYVAIFSIFVLGIASFSSNMTKARLSSQIILEVNNQGNQIINLITQTIRNSTEVTSPALGMTGSSLSVNSVTFSETGGVLFITEGSEDPLALTNNKVIISNLIFSNLSQPSSPETVQIRFTLGNVDSVRQEDIYSSNFYGSASLRK